MDDGVVTSESGEFVIEFVVLLGKNVVLLIELLDLIFELGNVENGGM